MLRFAILSDHGGYWPADDTVSQNEDRVSSISSVLLRVIKGDWALSRLSNSKSWDIDISSR